MPPMEHEQKKRLTEALVALYEERARHAESLLQACRANSKNFSKHLLLAFGTEEVRNFAEREQARLKQLRDGIFTTPYGHFSAQVNGVLGMRDITKITYDGDSLVLQVYRTDTCEIVIPAALAYPDIGWYRSAEYRQGNVHNSFYDIFAPTDCKFAAMIEDAWIHLRFFDFVNTIVEHIPDTLRGSLQKDTA